jgi:hypothetical protein
MFQMSDSTKPVTESVHSLSGYLPRVPVPLQGLLRYEPAGHGWHAAQSRTWYTVDPVHILCLYSPIPQFSHWLHVLCMGSVAPVPSTHLPEAMYSPGLHGWHGAQSLVSGANVSPLHLARMYVLCGHLPRQRQSEFKPSPTKATETQRVCTCCCNLHTFWCQIKLNHCNAQICSSPLDTLCS